MLSVRRERQWEVGWSEVGRPLTPPPAARMGSRRFFGWASSFWSWGGRGEPIRSQSLNSCAALWLWERWNYVLSYLCFVFHRDQGDLGRLGNHVGGELSHHVDLPGVLPRRHARLVDKDQRVEGSVVPGLRGDGDVDDPADGSER